MHREILLVTESARLVRPQRLSSRVVFPTESGAAIAGVRNWKNEVLPASVERSYQYRSNFLRSERVRPSSSYAGGLSFTASC